MLVMGAIVVGVVIVLGGIVVTGIVFPEIVSKTVDAGNVVGVVMVIPGTVVVRTTTDASAVTGIALPTPEPDHWGGMDSVAVFGFAAALFAYISPLSPLALVY